MDGASSAERPGLRSCLGRGIYDIAEVARLLRRRPTRVASWARPYRSLPPLLIGELDGLFSFWDLVSLRVIGELVDRGVPRARILRGAEHLANELQTSRPFAHQHIATVGAGFFARVADDWDDVGLGGQMALQGVIEPLLQPITFNDAQMASKWQPREHICIDPTVQAGAPCVEGTRVPTEMLAGFVDLKQKGGDDLSEVCDLYRLEEYQVEAAVEYERSLAA